VAFRLTALRRPRAKALSPPHGVWLGYALTSAGIVFLALASAPLLIGAT